MYVTVCSKEQWHTEGDEFLKVTGEKLDFGVVKHHEKSDVLSVYWNNWNSKIGDGILDVKSNDEFDKIDFKKIHLINQKFSLGEIAYDKMRMLYGEVVGLSLDTCVHIHDSKFVIPNVPMENLKPQVILDDGKVFLRGWIGEVSRKHWTITVKEGNNYQKFTHKYVPGKTLPSCPYEKLVIPIVGSIVKLHSGNTGRVVDRQLCNIKVDWYHKLRHYPYESQKKPPPKRIDKPDMLAELKEFDSNHFDDCKKHTLCTYTIRDTDNFIPLEKWEHTVFNDMLDLNDDSNTLDAKKRKKDICFPNGDGDQVLVNVLRAFTVLQVEWQGPNGQKIHEKVLSKDVTHQHRVKYPVVGCYRQFVTLKETYGSERKKLGITLQRNHSENLVHVQWLKKPGEILDVVEESEFDLIPHNQFGSFHINQLVERSSSCKDKDFIVGIIKEVTKDGFVIIKINATGENIVKLSPDELIVCPNIADVGMAQRIMALKREESESRKYETPLLTSLTSEFCKALSRDHALMEKYRLQTHLGIRFQPVTYRERCTAIIYGTEGTVYENGLFLFELYFPYTYPNTPPIIKMVTPFHNSVSFNFGRNGQLVRNLNGRLCPYPSNLVWEPNVTLEDILLSIKSFVFVEEPFVHSYSDWENGLTSFDFERIKIHRKDALRNYNHKVLIEVFDSLTSLADSKISDIWEKLILSDLQTAIPKMKKRLQMWAEAQNSHSLAPEHRPKFTLFPISKGMKASIKARMNYQISK